MKTKKRVVIADDSITVQKLVNLTLAGLNFEVITSMDGHDALMKIKRLKPELVLADTDLQEIAGAQLCEEVRSSSELIDTRLILMHGSQSSSSKEDYQSAPCDFLLEKPFDSKTLIGVVQKVLSEEPATIVRDPANLEVEAREEFESSQAPEEEVTDRMEDEDETVTHKAEGLFSSYRKAEGSVDLNSKLAAIAAEVAPSGFDEEEAETDESAEEIRPEQTINERLESMEEKPALVSEEEEQASASQLAEALDEVSKVSDVNDLAAQKVEPAEMEKLAREEIRLWLDQHLRPMVEDVVKEELAKITEDQDS